MTTLVKLIRIHLFLLFVVIGFTVNFGLINYPQSDQKIALNPTPSISPIINEPAITQITKTKTVPAVKKIVSKPKSKPSQTQAVVQPKQSPPPPVQKTNPTPDTRCIITIDSVRYDVTQFRTIHSGGDIFACGTDMSQTFWSRHGQQQLNLLQKYRI